MNDAKKIHPPETLEGWYALHQLFAHPVGLTPNEKEQARTAALLNKLAKPDGGGWSAVARVIGSVTDTMIVHFRPTLDAIGEVQRELNKDPYIQRLVSTYTFLSITEAGLYHITAELARDAVARKLGRDVVKPGLGDAQKGVRRDEALDVRILVELALHFADRVERRAKVNDHGVRHRSDHARHCAPATAIGLRELV